MPDVANAWLFVDRANLDEATEVSLLASVGNKYALKALQSAAIVLDRSMRKPWEKTGFKAKLQSVHQTEDVDPADSDAEGLLLDDPEGQCEELYLSYMTAKARYKEVAKARGIEYKNGERDGDANGLRKAAEAKITACDGQVALLRVWAKRALAPGCYLPEAPQPGQRNRRGPCPNHPRHQ